MNRTEKSAAVDTLSQLFRATPHVILTDFKGLTASEATDLRRRIRSAGGTYRVLKNRLARRGAVGTAVEKLAPRLKGPCGLAAHPTDPVALAKVLNEFAKENTRLQLVAAVVDAKDVYENKDIKTLAALPSLPQLRAQMLSLINTPATQLVRLLNTPAAQVARAIDARRGTLEGGAS